MGGLGPPPADIGGGMVAAPVPSDQFGKGPVKVALLLPLTGDPALAQVGQSLANGSRLAMDFIESNDRIADNISVVLKDTGPTAAGAARAASAAVAEGAQLILGPLRADQVQAVGSVARTAGLSVIAFSNNPGVAAPGVYLLNVLPETEMRRSLAYAKAGGRKSLAGIFSATDYGRAQETAFRRVAADLGLAVRSVLTVSQEAEARHAAQRLGPALLSGEVDALVLPDRALAPRLATYLAEAGALPGKLLLIGSADWSGDAAIASSKALNGAVYPAVDDAGYEALLAGYQARFPGTPHPLVTISYTATILANVSALSMTEPRYQRTVLTSPAGFNGRDGVFRFAPDGRSDYALTIRRVTPGGSVAVDAARIE